MKPNTRTHAVGTVVNLIGMLIFLYMYRYSDMPRFATGLGLWIATFTYLAHGICYIDDTTPLPKPEPTEEKDDEE